jgi:predicted deacylase
MNSVRVSSQKLSLGRKGVEAWVNTIAASAPGPVVVVTGNVHGDECTGVGVCLQLQKLLPESL